MRDRDWEQRRSPWWSLADRSIRTKLLAAFLFVAILPLGLLTLHNDRASRETLTEVANRSLLDAARQTATSLDAFLEAHLDIVATEARQPVLAQHLASLEEGGPGASQISTLLATFQGRMPEAIASYALLDRRGDNVADTDPRGVGGSEAGNDYFQKVMKAEGPTHVSRVEFSSDGRPYLTLSAPVRDPGGQAVGVLRARYHASILRDRIAPSEQEKLTGPPESFAMLFDERRIVLAHGAIPHFGSEDIRFRTVATAESLVEAMMAQRRLPRKPKDQIKSLSLDLPDLENGLTGASSQAPYFTARLKRDDPTLYAAAVAKTSREQWTVAFLQPRDAYLQPANEQTRENLLLGLILTGAVAALALAVAERLARPITRLTAVARQVAGGELDAQAPVTSQDEAGQLAAAFNTMTAQLRRLIQSLQDRIAERERAEESLSTTLNSIGDAVIATDTHGRVVRMNPVAERLTGWPMEMAAGQPLHDVFRIVNEDTRLPVVSPVDQVLASGGVVGLANHTVLLARGGSERPIADSGAPIRGREGRIEGVVLVFRDVTEERRAEEALRREHALLRQSEERFRLVIDQMPAFLWSTDRDLRFTLSLGAGLSALGLKPNETVGQTLFDYYQTDDPSFPAIAAAYRALEGESVSFDLEWEGSVFQCYVEPLRDSEGAIVGAIGVPLDISERK
ncbi:MAG TPA: PAS domain-containing protein, partial [Thermoanaerobaculia bacterium]|nr:PAS domain-containing protein [Thermoanaerobaculia bacterium]